MLLTITLIPLAVAFIFGIAEIVLRTKSHAANLSDIFRILEQMEASGQITSAQQRILMNTLLDSYYSSEEKLDIEVGESIRRHSDSPTHNHRAIRPMSRRLATTRDRLIMYVQRRARSHCAQ